MTAQLGKYRLVRLLGAGGMGEVWEAVDTVLDRPVAVKLLTDADDRADVVREASAAARVHHPNAVAVFDVAAVDGRWFIVMEFVNGTTAQQVSERGTLPWEQATRIARDAAAGLAAVHAAGLIHRDIKPSNILLAPDGTAKVADFGVARRAARTGLTTRSHTVGTPLYMSPEQCWSEAIDGRADVYALGATYFTLLTGRAPYKAATDAAVMYAHCHAAVPDPRAVVPDLPAGCAAVVARAMAKQPADRYATADAMREALDALLAGTEAPSAPDPASVRLPPQTVAPAPLRRALLTRRVALVAIPVAVAAGVIAFWPKADPNPSHVDADWTGPWEIGGPVQQIAISPDGRRTAVTVSHPDGTGAVHLRTRDGRSVEGWPRSEAGAEGVTFSPDGAWLAVAYRPWGRVRVLEVSGGREESVAGGENVPTASAVAFSADGQWLAAAGYTEAGVRVHVWQRSEGGWQRRHEFTAPEFQVWGLGFVPDGNVLALAVGNGPGDEKQAAVHLWDVTTGKEVPGPAGRLARNSVGPTLAFAAPAKLAAVSSHRTVRLFHTPDWQPVGQPLRVNFNGFGSELMAVALDPDGQWLAGSWEVEVRLWRIDNPDHTLWVARHEGRVNTLAAAPDGHTLLSGGDDGRVLVHDVDEWIHPRPWRGFP